MVRGCGKYHPYFLTSLVFNNVKPSFVLTVGIAVLAKMQDVATFLENGKMQRNLNYVNVHKGTARISK